MNQENKGILDSSLVAKLAAAFILVATVLVGVQAVRALGSIGESTDPVVHSITVDGTGKVSVAPDIAVVSFSVSEEGTTASQAQDAAAKKSNVALAVIRDLKVADKDIKTSSYNLSPKYSYQPPCYSGYCPAVDPKIVGYTVSQTVEVKIRDLDTVGAVLSALGEAGVSNLYGPNFTIDEPESVQAEARKLAIEEARAKAKILAKDLKVRLGPVMSFYESGAPGPYYYGKGGALDAASAPSPTIPELPAGENEIVVSVSITYEIR